MLIRGAQPEDALAVARVHVRSWQSAYRGHLPDDHLAGLDPVARAERYSFGIDRADTPHTVLAVDEDEGRVIGFATTGPCADAGTRGRLGELYGLYVDPDRWRTGCGRQLMTAARARLAGLGFREAVLWVLDGNSRAESFYGPTGGRATGPSGMRFSGPTGGAALPRPAPAPWCGRRSMRSVTSATSEPCHGAGAVNAAGYR